MCNGHPVPILPLVVVLGWLPNLPLHELELDDFVILDLVFSYPPPSPVGVWFFPHFVLHASYPSTTANHPKYAAFWPCELVRDLPSF